MDYQKHHQKSRISLNELERYDIIFVTVEDSLVHTKSGDQYPRNIGDFIPNYNLWYALKYCKTGSIWVIENKDITTSDWYRSGGWDGYRIRFDFICKWLSQVSEVKECHGYYSLYGNWIDSCGSNDDIITLCLRCSTNTKKVLFVDKNTKDNMKYIRSNYPNFGYLTTSEFIEKYNVKKKNF